MPPVDPWKNRWTSITPSQYPWEEEALQCLKTTFTGRALHAWSNFQFITQEGNVYEVDLLLLTRAGLFLIEIKSWPGTLGGDTHTWVVTRDDRSTKYLDNPILLADKKCKCLKSLLLAQPSFRGRPNLQIPYMQPVVFLSSSSLDFALNPTARHHVYTHADTQPGPQSLPAIVRALNTPKPGKPPAPITPTSEKAILEALARAGVRRPNRSVRVGDYIVGSLIDEGAGWQDRVAQHTTVDLKRRVRQYVYARQKSDEERSAVRRAARREFQFAEAVRHPNILRALELREHENGPALIYDYDADALRLDHYVGHHASLDPATRLRLVRQVAEAVAYAHSRKVLHRALSPRSCLVYDPESPTPTVMVTNWQTATRAEGTVTGTVHLRDLVEDDSTVYMAPEAIASPDSIGEYSDVFSLGALTHFVFTGQAPAPDRLALDERLREQHGLRPSAVCDAVPSELDDLVQMSTNPEVLERFSTVTEFLSYLDAVEERLAAPAETTVNPFDARAGDALEGGFTLVKRLGRGSVSLALLVTRDEREYVLKVAQTPADNATLEQEAAVLRQLRDRHVVELHDVLTLGDRTALLLARAGEHTLAERLQAHGPLQFDLLKRFGADLLDVLVYLEAQGIPHRDLKPANVAVAKMGKNERLELVLFDFSLSRAPLENVRAGTPHYLDPFLGLRRPPRWDLHAERYAAAATLYEMATGVVPRWGDGVSDPSLSDAALVLEPERFDATVREPLIAFFERALDRDWGARFDNAEEMRAAWLAVFERAGAEAGDLDAALEACTLDTPVADLPLQPALAQALDRLGVFTVKHLARMPLRDVNIMRGVGNDSRRRLSELVTRLQARFPKAAVRPPATDAPVFHGLDPIVQRLYAPDAGAAVGRVSQAVLAACRDGDEDAWWPASGDLSEATGLSVLEVRGALDDLRDAWARDGSLKALRDTVADVVAAGGAVVEADELVTAVLAARGSVQQDVASRRAQARAAARAALEVEEACESPRFLLRRGERAGRLYVASTPDLAGYAEALGQRADALAGEDPLVGPQRALQLLREVPLPAGADDLSDHRLLRLAAAASGTAALSSRQELYPRGMDAFRALVLAHGSLLGESSLTVGGVRERVSHRYPEARPLPEDPVALLSLLREAQWDFDWSDAEQAFVRPERWAAFTTGSSLPRRYDTTDGTRGVVTPEMAEARAFEERLRHAEREGAFLVLSTAPKSMRQAEDELRRRFDVEPLMLDAAMLDEMRRQAAEHDVRWDVVLDTDALPGHPDFVHLIDLARRSMEAVERRVEAAGRTVLLSRPGLLARYGLMDRVERLRDTVGRRDGPFGVWLLVPTLDNQGLPVLDGEEIPLLTPAQRARIPQAWLENRHRTRAEATA